MATQTLEFSAGTGLTLSCKLFALGSDTVVATASASEKANDKNRYSVAFTSIPAGAYRLNAFVGATGGFANEVYDLTLTTATFQPRSESAVDAGGIADAVWNEPYNQHTTAGSFGKLMDLLRKSNMVLEATVQASPAPTATTFNVTGLNYPTGAFGHAVLFFADDATLAEQNSPILTFTNNGNGTQTIVLEEARTAAPVAGDKVLIDATSHVHAIADIQSGLALQTTSLAIKAKTDLITAGQVTYTSPVGGTGKISIPIIIGDDYLASNARAFEWTITARTGVVVGTASCRFGGTNEELNKSWLVTGTVSDIGGGQCKLSFDLTKTVTGALEEGYYRWSVELLSAGGTEITEVFSGRNVEVRNKQT
jgi:hypothetical protein